MKTIGFVDYYLSEWHANNYPVWIREICEKTGKKFCVKYAWAEKEVSPVDGKTTEEWCKTFGAEKCASIEELCEKSDYILVLAPSNPETHLRLAEKVLPFGKRTYIDKTFAPDFAASEKIFDIAKRYNTPFFSTSALRYATELNSLIGSDKIIVAGGGGAPVRLSEQLNPGVSRRVFLGDPRTIVGRPIVDDNHLPARIRLPQDRLDGLRKKPPAVVDRRNDGYKFFF